VLGVADNGIDVFRGIPYAAASIGDLRWRAPRPAPAWKDDRDAAAFGPICSQKVQSGFKSSSQALPQSEDCLSLNVWRPAGAKNAPVMVWIHGGANRWGAGSDSVYDGDAFARRGIVLVTLNYRLGYLGFFAHPALTREAGPDAPAANFGLLDQVAALKWVRANAAAFGGDPRKITVFGQSAGGTDILALLSRPDAKTLFFAAIVESGGAGSTGGSLEAGEKVGVEIADKLGLGKNPTTAQLRALTPEQILNVDGGHVSPGFGPIVDGRVIAAAPLQTLLTRGSPVPLLIGANSDDGNLMQLYGLSASKIMREFGGESPSMRKAYGALGDDEASYARRLYRDVKFVAPARAIASTSKHQAPIWLYRFDYTPTAVAGKLPGAAHASEIPFVFDNVSTSLFFSYASDGANPSEKDAEIAYGMNACWVAFATHRDPARAPLCSAWEPYDPKEATWFVFDQKPSPRPRLDKEQLDVIEAANAKSPNGSEK
jgi:para-nitrobenzyl esterase